ncbi:hypothetical protein HDG34_002563 [Paraburkholderia sp. HC6.4b]|uniref:hypothetical protein n=1 Tax=unclassified Paraburkholderia TaxID=2615204 RepID=UPI001615B1CF|nr:MULTISPECIES: hypothetical protein [unclassified Paraburkholderia]MBB5408626.1 hypothetical protein [Paraburkholderia sp. HC6.4b]MBB5450458.1 hypothetical protein [Paraburkholderia sp. Kb1A]
MPGTPLFIGEHERTELQRIRLLANARPVDMRTLPDLLLTPEGKAAHRDRMTGQTIAIPAAYLVTFSVETNQPHGTARHMSMSVQREGRLPNGYAAWLVAQELGFTGSLDECTTWLEDLHGHGKAVNVVQYITGSEARA